MPDRTAQIEPVAIEPERYELTAPPAYRFAVDRRDFIGLLGGGLLVVFSAGAQESGRGRRSEALPQELDAWLHIGEDGAVSLCTGKTEVGQNIRTSLSQAAAEELHCPIASIKLVMADTALVPYDMGTFGSRTTPTMAPQIRRAAATAREALLDLAAEKWNVDRAKLSIADGKIAGPGAATIGFGELTKGQKISKTIAPGVPVARPLSQSAPKVAAREFVTGQHKYTSDMTRPGMLYGRVLRPPAFGATLANLDASSLPGVTPAVTIVHEKNFVGVAAPDAQTAAAALRQIKAEWTREAVPPAAASGPGLYQYLKQTAEPGEPNVQGSVADGMAAADIKLEAAYTVAYIAHAPLEPRAALAEWDGGKLTVWTGSQVPFGVRSELASAFGIPDDRVRVIVPDTRRGIRRQAFRRMRRGSRAPGESRRQARQARVDPRRRIHLVLLPPRRPHRNLKRRPSRWRNHGLGVPQLQLRRLGLVGQVRHPQPAQCFPPRQVASPPGILPRPGRHRQPFRA